MIFRRIKAHVAKEDWFAVGLGRQHFYSPQTG